MKKLIASAVIIIIAIAAIFFIKNRPAVGLTMNDVANATYDVSSAALYYSNYSAVKLVNGMFHDSIVNTYPTTYKERVDHTVSIATDSAGRPLAAFGDLNGDGEGDAAVVIGAQHVLVGNEPANGYRAADTGTSTFLFVFVYDNGAAKAVGHAFPQFGSHTITAVHIRDGLINVLMGTTSVAYKIVNGLIVTPSTFAGASNPTDLTPEWSQFVDASSTMSIEYPSFMTLSPLEPSGMQLVFPNSFYPASTTIHANFQIIVSRAPLFTDCATDTQGLYVPKEVIVNGIPFYLTGEGDAAMGTIFETTSYSTWNNGTCYSLVKHLRIGNLMNYPYDAETMKRLSALNAGIVSKANAFFMTLVSTFKFQ